MNQTFNQALASLKRGSCTLIIDDAQVTPFGCLVANAALISPTSVMQLVQLAGGVICAAVREDRLKQLGLPPMNPKAGSQISPFTVSIEARQGVTTGISAADRAQTLRTLALTTDPKQDLVMPGHIFPISAKQGGVLVKSALAEAAVDLMDLSELQPTAAFCHCLNKTGELSSEAELRALADAEQIPVITISDIIRRRLSTETIVEKIAEAELPTAYAGSFRAVAFRSKLDGAEHLALLKGFSGTEKTNAPVLVRVHAARSVDDLMGVEPSRSRQQLRGALQAINTAGRGILVYVRHPRTGLLEQQVKTLAQGGKPVGSQSQLREYGVGAQILSALGAQRIILLTNSVRDIAGTSAFNIEIVGKQPFDAAVEFFSETNVCSSEHI